MTYHLPPMNRPLYLCNLTLANKYPVQLVTARLRQHLPCTIWIALPKPRSGDSSAAKEGIQQAALRRDQIAGHPAAKRKSSGGLSLRRLWWWETALRPDENQGRREFTPPPQRTANCVTGYRYTGHPSKQGSVPSMIARITHRLGIYPGFLARLSPFKVNVAGNSTNPKCRDSNFRSHKVYPSILFTARHYLKLKKEIYFSVQTPSSHKNSDDHHVGRNRAQLSCIYPRKKWRTSAELSRCRLKPSIQSELAH